MKKYIIPSLYTLGIIIFGTLISSILYYFNITSDKINSVLLYLICFISIFIGSLMIGKKTNQKGIITGLIYFLIWFIIMFLMSSLIFKTNFKISSLIYYIIMLVFSILGSIIGKNSQKETTI